MSLFNKIFGGSSVDSSNGIPWKNITSDEDLNNAIEESKQKRVAIFKHSTRCFISQTVLKNFENEMKNSDKEVSLYFLDLLAYRPLSNRIEAELNVPHQSPQLIVLEEGKAVKSASHHSISESLI